MTKYIRNSFVALLSFLILVFSIMPAIPQTTYAAVSNWQKGVSIISASTDDWSSNNFKQSVQNARNVGVNYVSLIIPYYQSNANSTDIGPGWNTPSDQTIVNAVNYVHSLGLKVMFKPHLESYDGNWRAYIDPVDRNTWFSNYGAMLNHLADLAQQNNVEGFCLGTELISMATYTSHSDNTQRWMQMINAVRARYSGHVTYSASWGGGDFPNEKAHIGFFGALDSIGLSAYFNLQTPSTNPEDIKKEWQKYLPEIQALSTNNNNKPVLFTEIGYRSVNWAHQWPWNWSYQGSYDPVEQQNSYEALFSFWNNYPWMIGVHLWHWESNPNAGGSGNQDYTPQNKPAQDVMKKWFGSTVVDPGNNYTFTGSGTISPNQPTVNQQVTLQPTVTINGTASQVIVDIEIYDSSNTKIFQKFYEGESFSQNLSKNYSITWTPTQTDNYYMTIGVFNNNWTQNYYWNNVKNFSVVTGTTPPPPPANPTFSVDATLSPNPAHMNQSATIETSLTSNTNHTNVLVDVEIYNSSNQRVHQQFFENQNLVAQQSKKVNVSWTPTQTGSYTLMLGVFSGNWAQNYYWNSSVTSLIVDQTNTPPPINPPPQANYSTNIWWPSNGVTIQGVQPFKAMIEGLDVAEYRMYWQVDGGTLSEMFNSSQDYPHKEVLVDISSWNWSSNGQYTINFVSNNSSGSTISQKSITINK